MINDLAKDAATPAPLPTSISKDSIQSNSTYSSRSSTIDSKNDLKPIISNTSDTSTNHHVVKPSSFNSSTSSIVSNTTNAPSRRIHRAETAKLKEYGQCFRRLGEGSTAVVMITRKLEGKGEKLYAIKQFRKRQRSESEKQYMKKLTSEFCISSTFSHRNVVETIDLVLDDRKRYNTVMEYCPGGDLFGCIMSECMTEIEKGCCFKQLIHGLAYIHSVGVAHRDIKPENLLLAADGTVKITDFGVSDVFRFAWTSQGHKSRGLMGSEPYIAPEAFDNKEYWGTAADVWSAGIVLYCLWTQGLVWHRAKKTDAAYASYLRKHSTQQFELFSKLPTGPRRILYAILDPNPDTRLSCDDILNDSWVKSIDVCVGGVGANNQPHHHVPSSRKGK
ncbi:kinase-like domain-containing protein [Chlamydoabsidia padenii]|nr:kinase-like domain-containing protein [Chlamydoabsidia padenii]